MTNSTPYGLTVAGKIRVFRKDKQIKANNSKKTYDITDVWFNVSEKNDDGSYFNQSMNMIFKKGLELPENNSVIIIKESFPMITGNDQWRKITLYVGAWEAAEDAPEK